MTGTGEVQRHQGTRTLEKRAACAAEYEITVRIEVLRFIFCPLNFPGLKPLDLRGALICPSVSAAHPGGTPDMPRGG